MPDIQNKICQIFYHIVFITKIFLYGTAFYWINIERSLIWFPNFETLSYSELSRITDSFANAYIGLVQI